LTELPLLQSAVHKGVTLQLLCHPVRSPVTTVTELTLLQYLCVANMKEEQCCWRLPRNSSSPLASRSNGYVQDRHLPTRLFMCSEQTTVKYTYSYSYRAAAVYKKWRHCRKQNNTGQKCIV